MNKYKKGDKSKFSFGKKITDVKKTNFEYKEIRSFGVCPNCGHNLLEEFTYNIIELLEIDNGDYYVGYSDAGHTLKIDKDKIKELLK